MDNKKIHLNSLDGLRGFAAAAVATLHATQAADYNMGGAILVDLFFVLSGFVISYNYIDVIRSKSTRWIDFIVSRLARLYPLYIFSSLFIAASAVLGTLPFGRSVSAAFNIGQLVREITLTTALPYLSAGQVWNSPAWSVVVEWWINLTLFPLIVLFGQKLGARSLILITVAANVLLALWIMSLKSDGSIISRGLPALARGGVGFFGGWVAFYCWKHPRFSIPLVVSDILVLMFLVTIYAYHFAYNIDPWFILFLMPLIVLGLASDRGISKYLFSGKLMVYLGSISYSIYLWHFPVIKMLKTLGPRLPLHSPLAWIVATLVPTLILSAASYSLLEKPSRRWIRQAWESHRRGRVHASG